MESFDSIFERAAKRKGGAQALEALLPHPKSKAELAEINDADALREMTKCIFRSGFVWQIIENKWPGFEDAFHQFDVSRCAMLSDEDLERLQENTAIVRNAKKIQSVQKNARFILEVRDHALFELLYSSGLRLPKSWAWTFGPWICRTSA